MRWFHQDVTRIGQGQQMAGAQLRHEIRHDVVIGAGDQLQRNAFSIQGLLQPFRRLPDLRTGIMVQARQDVRRTGDDRHTIGHESPGHRDGDSKVGSPVINAGQDMTVQVDHSRVSSIVRSSSAPLMRQSQKQSSPPTKQRPKGEA